MDQTPHRTRRDPKTPHSLPALLTSGEVAKLLRTTRRAVYAMVERGQLPGVVRLGRRVLVRAVGGGRQSWFTRSRERPARRLGTGPRVGRSCRDSGCSACCVGRTPRGPRGIQQIQGDASARVRDVGQVRRTDASVLPRRQGSSRRRGDRHRRPRVQGLVRRKARHAPARPLSARGRARSSSGFVPIGDVVAGVELLDGRALTPAAPQALHHVVELGQVGGQGRVIEPEAGEPDVELAEGAGVRPAGVGADRRGD